MRLETLGLLFDIREAAKFISDDTEGITYEVFLSNRQTRQSVERNFITIGEAVNRLRQRDPDVASRISAVAEIIGMRNVLIHAYREIDYARIWRTIETSLPQLLREVELLFAEGNREDSR